MSVHGPPPPHPPGGAGRARPTVDAELGALAAVLGFAVVWNVIGNLLLPGAWYVPANLLAAVLLVVVARGGGLSWSELGLERRAVPRGLRFGLVAAVAVAVVLALGLAVPPIESILEDDTVAADPGWTRWFRPLIRIPFGTVVLEELLFRAVLFALVARRRGETAAVVITAALFGLWHVVPAWETVEGAGAAAFGTVLATVVATTAAGVTFALLRRWSGSIVAPVLAHGATNSLTYVAAVLAVEVIA